MSRKYIVSHAGQEMGPYSDNELRRMVKNQELLPIDYLYDEEKKDWLMIGERIDLQSESPTSSQSPFLTSTLDDLPPPQTVVARKSAVLPVTLVTTTAPKTTVTSVSATATSVSATRTATAGSPMSLPSATSLPSLASTSPSTVSLEDLTTTQAKPLIALEPAVTTAVRSRSSEALAPGKIKFSGGVGQIALDPRVAGTIQLGLKECSTPGVALPPRTELLVQSGAATKLLWNLRQQVPAGDELKVEIVAQDDFDNVATNFSASFEVHTNHPQFGKVPVDVVNGLGQFKLQLTLTGQFQFDLKALAPNSLHLPKSTTVTVRPGPAVKLTLESPREVVAGQSVQVIVKAVDAFGNLVTDYNGDASLEIKAS